MIYSEIIALARSLYAIDSVQFDDALALKLLKAIDREIRSTIIEKVDENIFERTFLNDIFTWIQHYDLSPIEKVRKVYLLVNGDYVPLEKDKWNMLESQLELIDVPEEDVTDGIMIKGILAPSNIVLTESPQTPEDYHMLYVSWLAPCIYQVKGLLNEKAVAKKEYEDEKWAMVSWLTNRIIGDVESEEPNLSLYH